MVARDLNNLIGAGRSCQEPDATVVGVNFSELVTILAALGGVALLGLVAGAVVLIRGDDTPAPQPTGEQPEGAGPAQDGPVVLRVGGRAKVTAEGDDRHGQVGIVKALLDEDDGVDVVLRFVEGPDVYAYRRDEVVAVPQPQPAEAEVAKA